MFPVSGLYVYVMNSLKLVECQCLTDGVRRHIVATYTGLRA